MAASSLDQAVKNNVIKWVFFGLSVSLSLFLIINGAIPGDKSGAESNWLANVFASIINAFNNGAINDSNFVEFAGVLRKVLGHFLAFLIDGVFISIATFYFLRTKKWYRFYYPILISFGLGLFVAGLSEVLQIFTADRVGSFTDVLIDMGGFLLGMAGVYLTLFLTKRLVFVNNQNE